LEINPPVRVERPVARKVEETVVAPVTIKPAAPFPTVKSPPTLDEALEINPLCKLESPVAKKVEETVVAPEIESVPPMEDEALEINPLWSVLKPVAKKVEETVIAPLTLKVPPMVEEALEINPPARVTVGLIAKVVMVEVATPLKNTELEAFRLPLENRLPETVRGELIEEEALEIKPPVRVERPLIPRVPEEVILPDESVKNLPRLKPEAWFMIRLPVISMLEEALVTPSTVSGALIVEEAEERKPPVRVERPDCNSVPEALVLPEEST